MNSGPILTIFITYNTYLALKLIQTCNPDRFTLRELVKEDAELVYSKWNRGNSATLGWIERLLENGLGKEQVENSELKLVFYVTPSSIIL